MTEISFEAGALAAVSCDGAGAHPTLVFERDLRHPPDRVWAALTEPAQLAQWAPYTADRDLAQVGEAVLTMLGGDAPAGSIAVVTRAEPPNVLEYTWGSDVLRWELTASATGTHVTLRHTVQGLDWVPKVAAGWHLCLVVAERLLDGQPIPPIRGGDARNFGWDGLNEAYGAALDIPVTLLPD